MKTDKELLDDLMVRLLQVRKDRTGNDYAARNASRKDLDNFLDMFSNTQSERMAEIKEKLY